MAFLESTSKQTTAIYLNWKFQSIKYSMETAKQEFEFIKNWIINVQNNEDYSDEDKQEVINKLWELRQIAISLTE